MPQALSPEYSALWQGNNDKVDAGNALPAVVLQSQAHLRYGCAFATGLTVVTTAADDITVVYT